MADQKDQDSNPPSDPTFIPLPKGSMAGKSLAGKTSEPEPESESDSDSDSEIEITAEEYRKMKIQELKEKAYYSLLKAFKAETLTVSDKRNQIIQKLNKEWDISQETYLSISGNVEKDLQSSDDESDSSWGNVNPKSLVGKSIRLRYSEEDPFEEHLIKDYDAIMDKHLVVNPDGTEMEMSDILNWMDIRTIPATDIIWKSDEKPDFDAPNKSSA